MARRNIRPLSLPPPISLGEFVAYSLAGDAFRRPRRRNGRRSSHQRSEAESRDWGDLPPDVLSVIFKKLGTIDLIWLAQAVCRSWWQVAHEPHVYRCIDMRHHAKLVHLIDLEKLAREAVDRSGGYVEEFYAEGFGSNDLLDYIADRTTGLRSLVLTPPIYICESKLAEFVGRCPLLEEFQVNNYSSSPAYGDIGRRASPNLLRFRWNTKLVNDQAWHGWRNEYDTISDDNSIQEIANNMPQLIELQLIGNRMSNKGLRAILDKCLNLKSLDIRDCRNIRMDPGLQLELAAKINTVRFPNESTEDFEWDSSPRPKCDICNSECGWFQEQRDYENCDDHYGNCDDDYEDSHQYEESDFPVSWPHYSRPQKFM